MIVMIDFSSFVKKLHVIGYKRRRIRVKEVIIQWLFINRTLEFDSVDPTDVEFISNELARKMANHDVWIPYDFWGLRIQSFRFDRSYRIYLRCDDYRGNRNNAWLEYTEFHVESDIFSQN